MSIDYSPPIYEHYLHKIFTLLRTLIENNAPDEKTLPKPNLICSLVTTPYLQIFHVLLLQTANLRTTRFAHYQWSALHNAENILTISIMT